MHFILIPERFLVGFVMNSYTLIHQCNAVKLITAKAVMWMRQTLFRYEIFNKKSTIFMNTY